MTAALCTVSATVTGAASPPGGGRASVESVLWQVSAELRGAPFPANDGSGLVDQIITGTVAGTPIFVSGYLVGYKDSVGYTISLPFIDQLFIGATPLTAPFSAFYLITETYNSNLNFNTLVPVGVPAATSPFSVTRKVRPLSAGGANQAVTDILI